ncbi:MAG TPA: alpha/beta hydrolase [Cyclobacteriaceae bacterium]|nr:alpha/beta hydrolase [Cyclobacteriaceae bacterium]
MSTIADDRTTVYLFPGQGADHRLFSKFCLDPAYHVVHIKYPEPGPNETVRSYANAIAGQIDPEGRYAFVGVSLGGMICADVATMMKPEKVIIISSARCRKELPLLYRLQSKIPINRMLPAKWLKWGAQFIQPFWEPDCKNGRDTFLSMQRAKTPEYYKRTIDMIINWDREKPLDSAIHIHGTHDRTLPIGSLKPDYVIEGGSHLMTLTRGEEICKLVNEIMAKSMVRTPEVSKERSLASWLKSA